MAEKSVKRIQIRLSETNAKKIDEMADRYGMSVNSLVGFIVGQWLDNNYDLRDMIRQKQMQILDESANKTVEHLLQNPEKLEQYKELFKVMGVPVDEE